MNRVFLLVLLSICTLTAWTAETKIAKDGMLVVDGQRRFVVGLYEEAKDAASAAETAQAGFNLIRVSPNKDSLSRAQQNGLMAWIPLGGLAVNDATQGTQLKEIVNTWKSHPALAIWEAPDEALWNEWWGLTNRVNCPSKQVNDAVQSYKGSDQEVQSLKDQLAKCRHFSSTGRYTQAEETEDSIRKLVGLPALSEKLSVWRDGVATTFNKLNLGCKTVRQADPNHVLWFNHAPRNSLADLSKYGKLADIAGCDIYPVPFGSTVGHSDLSERNLPCVGRFTQRMGAAIPGKPVWMVLQGFGWDDLAEVKVKEQRPRPTYQQSRFMAYNAITNGARGILYWGTPYVPKDAKFLPELKQVITELHQLEPFLSAPDANRKLTFTPHPSAASDEKGSALAG